MRDLKEVVYVIFAIATILILIWWVGHALAWRSERADRQRLLCVQETKDPAFCQVEW